MVVDELNKLCSKDFIQSNRLFHILLRFYLAPRKSIIINRFSKEIKTNIGNWSAGCQVINDCEKYYQLIPTFRVQKFVTYFLLQEFYHKLQVIQKYLLILSFYNFLYSILDASILL